jgi:glycosyltransferase involved in cell wall biosynthesis
VISTSNPEEIKKGIRWFLNLPKGELITLKQNALETIRGQFTWEVLSQELIKQLQAHSKQI